MSNFLRFVLPNGSLAQKTREYLAVAGFPVPQKEPDRQGFCGVSNGVEFFQFDRRAVPNFIATKTFHAGITGKDLVANSKVTGLTIAAELRFSRATEMPTRWVLAKRKGDDLTGRKVRVACELPDFAAVLLGQVRFADGYEVVPISGSEEQYVKHGLADAVLVVTETGSSIRANDLEIHAGCDALFTSVPQIIALPGLPEPQTLTLRALSAAMRGVVGAQDYILLKADIRTSLKLGSLQLPAEVAPSILPTSDPDWCAIEICILRSRYGHIAAELEEAGAKGIVMVPIAGHHPGK